MGSLTLMDSIITNLVFMEMHPIIIINLVLFIEDQKETIVAKEFVNSKFVIKIIEILPIKFMVKLEIMVMILMDLNCFFIDPENYNIETKTMEPIKN